MEDVKFLGGQNVFYSTQSNKSASFKSHTLLSQISYVLRQGYLTRLVNKITIQINKPRRQVNILKFNIDSCTVYVYYCVQCICTIVYSVCVLLCTVYVYYCVQCMCTIVYSVCVLLCTVYVYYCVQCMCTIVYSVCALLCTVYVHYCVQCMCTNVYSVCVLLCTVYVY